MGSVSSTSVSKSTPTVAKQPFILNLLTNVTPDTEDEFIFPVGTKRFSIKNPGPKHMKVAYEVGDSGVNYFTLYAGCSCDEDTLAGEELPFYFQSPAPAQRFEVVYWT